MRLLYILQQSIFNSEGKWLTADSNINMAVGFFEQLIKKRPDIKIDVLIAPIDDFADLGEYDHLIKHPNINYIPFAFPVSPFYLRQHFNVHEFLPVLKNDYDVIINNITEISRNIKTLLHINKLKAKLITQCFWLDCPEINEEKIDRTISYDWRQFDAFECSDLVTFTCKSTKEAFLANAIAKFQPKYLNKILSKSSIWDFGYSQTECEYFKPSAINRTTDKKKIILFLNRLSDINYSHHIEFIEAIKLLSKLRDDFVVIFTNPSKKGKIEGIPNVSNYLNGKVLSRDEYWNLLHNAHISVHLFTIERYSGCALRESIAANNIPIVADCFEQKELVYNKELRVKVTNNQISNIDLLNSLNYALNNVENIDLQEIQKLNYDQCSFESVIDNVIDDIDSLFKEGTDAE